MSPAGDDGDMIGMMRAEGAGVSGGRCVPFAARTAATRRIAGVAMPLSGWTATAATPATRPQGGFIREATATHGKVSDVEGSRGRILGVSNWE